MKLSKTQVRTNVYAIPEVQFESEQMTSFAGAVVTQALLGRLGFKQRLATAFKTAGSPVYGLAVVLVDLIVHLTVGFSSLRDRDVYDGDPLLLRVLGLRRLPVVSTMVRTLAQATPALVDAARSVLRELVIERVCLASLARVMSVLTQPEWNVT